jgi:hypothetical protein
MLLNQTNYTEMLILFVSMKHGPTAQGSIIYFKSFLMNQIRLISSEVYNNLSNYIIIDCFSVSNTFIIIVYKSPKISLKELLNILISTFG